MVQAADLVDKGAQVDQPAREELVERVAPEAPARGVVFSSLAERYCSQSTRLTQTAFKVVKAVEVAGAEVVDGVEMEGTVETAAQELLEGLLVHIQCMEQVSRAIPMGATVVTAAGAAGEATVVTAASETWVATADQHQAAVCTLPAAP